MMENFWCIYLFSDKCDNMIDHEKGEITSPNYPFDYGPDLKCTHVIEAPKDYVIVTTIVDFDVS